PDVDVLRTRVLEIEADQVDAGRPKMVREKDGPIAIGESAEIPQASGGPRLGRGHRLAGEERSPFTDRRTIVPMAVDEDDRSRVVRLHLIRYGAVQVRHNGRRNPTPGHRDRGRLVRRHQDTRCSIDLPCQVRAVASDRDLFSFEERKQLLVGSTCPTQRRIEFPGDLFVRLPREPEVFQDLEVARLPAVEFHSNPQTRYPSSTVSERCSRVRYDRPPVTTRKLATAVLRELDPRAAMRLYDAGSTPG